MPVSFPDPCGGAGERSSLSVIETAPGAAAAIGNNKRVKVHPGAVSPTSHGVLSRSIDEVHHGPLCNGPKHSKHLKSDK